MRSLLVSDGEPFFPLAIPFRKASAQQWLDDFASLRASAEALHAASKAVLGAGYSVELREVAHQKLGQLRVPERIVFESADDLAHCVGETGALRRFREIAETIRAREPRLVSWLAERPFVALESESEILRLLDTVAYFQAQQRPNRFARELGIAGVDSKFIEANRSVLSEWLDRLLPVDAIDSSVRGLADRGFERRYGLRFEEPQIRFRWLDPSHRLAGRISEASVPLSEFAFYAPACERVVITENKINFLTLPESIGTLAIFGRGYAADLLGSVGWLGEHPLHYWGDLDTHGFSVLSRLRTRWPHARSLLMNREMLMAHRELWTEEPADRRCLRNLHALNEHEQSLYDDLRYDRLGSRVRLEQERIAQSEVDRAIRDMRLTHFR